MQDNTEYIGILHWRLPGTRLPYSIMKWLAYSLYWNLVEHVCIVLRERLHERHPELMRIEWKC